MNDGRIFKGFEYSLHAVFHGQYKTGGKLAQSSVGVHQGGRVGQEPAVGHHVVKDLFDPLYLGLLGVIFLGPGNMPGDPSEHLCGCFNHFPGAVLSQIPSFQNRFGIIRKRKPVSNKKRFFKTDRGHFGKPQFHELNSENLVDNGLGDGIDGQLINGSLEKLADISGLLRADGIIFGQAVRKTPVVPDVAS